MHIRLKTIFIRFPIRLLVKWIFHLLFSLPIDFLKTNERFLVEVITWIKNVNDAYCTPL